MDQSPIVTGKPVAVIGAGVSGLAAAKRLAAEGFQVDVYERRSQAGGLWNFSPDPNTPLASAVYRDLQTNFPRQLMELQDYPWANQPLFMNHTLVQQYLEGYSRNIQKEFHSRVRFNFGTEVVRLFHESYAGGHWELIYQSAGVLTGENATRRYLFVVVAVGVYDEPFIPDYIGLPDWRRLRKGSVSHAKSYRHPEGFYGKASGFDIAKSIAPFALKLWVSSTRPVVDGLPEKARKMAGIKDFSPSSRMVRFLNGECILDVDNIIFCTGYQYHQPFIKKNSTTNEPLFPSGISINHLHEHVIYVEQPTLAFLGVVRGAIPTFLVVQAQAAFVARFFADHVRALSPRKDDPQHRLPYPLFVNYLLRLESLCERADEGRLGRMTESNNPIFHWTPELELVRTKRGEIRGAFLSHNNVMTGIWSTVDTLHEYHRKFLTTSNQNIVALVPFLILSYGYKDDHNSDLILPFEGWEEGFGQIIGKSIIDSTRILFETLGPQSNDVISRGSQKLFHLIRHRWSRWAGTRKWEETDQLEDWRKAFEKFSLLQAKGGSSPQAPAHNPPCAPVLRPARRSSPARRGPQVFTVRVGFDVGKTSE